MAISIVQQVFLYVAGGGNVTISATSAGNTLVVLLGYEGNLAATTITDNKSSIYTHCTNAGADRTLADAVTTDAYYSKNIASGITTLTVTPPGACDVYIYELAGASTTAPFDSANNLTSSSLITATTPAITPSRAGNILVAWAYFSTGNIDMSHGFAAPWTGTYTSGPALGDGGCYYLNAPLSSQQATDSALSPAKVASTVVSIVPDASGPSNATKTGMFLI